MMGCAKEAVPPMTIFQYDAAILARYPALVGGVLLVQGVRNGPTPPALGAAYRGEQQATMQRIGATPWSQIDALAAWRGAFRGFGVEPTQYRSAAEAVLRRLTKSGEIPSINALVDLGTLVSIRYALPVAVFDLRAVQGALTVRFAQGAERYTPLGQAEVEHPEPGEVVFCDDSGLVAARRWCWRQSAQSAAGPDTTTALITIEAHHPRGRADVQAAVDDLRALLPAAVGGTCLAAVLDAVHPAFAR
jgi:DNA/RNA-binding domain of Phe-tRNA-synthetase-like protein